MGERIDTKDLTHGLAQVRALREAATLGPFSVEGDCQSGGLDYLHITVPINPRDNVADGIVATIKRYGAHRDRAAANAALFAAAPAMADLLDAYAARLAEVEAERDRLAAELAEARMVLAAERGEVDGAPSDGWSPHTTDVGFRCWAKWSGRKVVATAERVSSGWRWYLDGTDTAGVCQLAREAMKAADAALRDEGGTDVTD